MKRIMCEDCIHKAVCYEKEEDREALKFCSDYFNLTKELNKIIEFIGKQFINEPIDQHDLSRMEYHRQFMRDINDFYCMYEEEKKKENKNDR